MKVYTELERALDVIPNAENWCQWITEDESGRHCALGAAMIVAGQSAVWGNASAPEVQRLMKPLNVAAKELGEYAAVSLNNRTDYATVRACFQRAIRNEKAKASTSVALPAAPVASELVKSV